jgi:hypothetical protein
MLSKQEVRFTGLRNSCRRKRKEVIRMLIHVMYPGSTYDYVKEFMLDKLIETRKIASFQRANGWVSIGADPVRAENKQKSYYGIEKRKTE